jgi:integrase
VPTIKFTKIFITSVEPTTKRVTYYDSDTKGLVLRVTPTGVKTYSLIYRNQQKQQKRYTIGKDDIISLPLARKEAQRLSLLVIQGNDIQKENKDQKLNSESKQNMSFKNYLDSFYLEWCKKNHKCHASTCLRLNVTLKPLHDSNLEEIDIAKLNKFLYSYKKLKNVSNETLNRTVTTLKGAITKAVEFGYLKTNSLSGFKKFKEREGKIRYLDENETTKFMDILNNDSGLTKDIISTAYYTGMRRGEIFSLDWDDIDFKTNQILLNSNNTKSGKSRNIPMHKIVYSTLINIKENNASGIIFKSPITGNKLDNINRSWHSFLDKTEIKNFRFHDLRHNFASQLIMKGESLTVVRDLLGHSDFKMTLRYAHLAPEHKQKAIDLL